MNSHVVIQGVAGLRSSSPDGGFDVRAGGSFGFGHALVGVRDHGVGRNTSLGLLRLTRLPRPEAEQLRKSRCPDPSHVPIVARCPGCDGGAHLPI